MRRSLSLALAFFEVTGAAWAQPSQPSPPHSILFDPLLAVLRGQRPGDSKDAKRPPPVQPLYGNGVAVPPQLPPNLAPHD